MGDDGVTRPVLEAKVQAANGSLQPAEFLIDSGADRTVLGYNLLISLGFSISPAPEGEILKGITGGCGFTPVRTVIELACDDGGTAAVRGEYAALTGDSATDLSILGRDVLNLFDVILSHRRTEILLLAKTSTYRVVMS